MIVVCGEALIDLVHDDGRERPTPGGGPFNTACALARMGVPTAFLGHFSRDNYGRMLVNRLTTDGASLALATFGPEPTTIAVASVGPDGLADYQFDVDGTSAAKLTPEMLPSHLPSDVRALYLGSLGLVLEPMASSLVELLRRETRDRMLMLDPNVRPSLISDAGYRPRLEGVISQATIVKASAEDLAWIYPEIDHTAAADRLIAGGVPLVLVTLGAKGAYGATGTVRVHVSAPPVEVVDTIGAGDAFGAAALTWLHEHDRLSPQLVLSEDDVESLLQFSCFAASLTCTRSGSESPWRWEMPALV